MSACDPGVPRDLIVAAARSYIGTPYAHQGRVPGLALDCLGVLLALTKELGLANVTVQGYSLPPDPVRLREETRRHMEEIQFGALAPADVITFDIAGRETHYGLITQMAPGAFVHAYGPVGRVVEQTLNPVWLRRLRGCWRFRRAAPWRS